jgi:prophage DNA circulation protein
MADPAWRTSLRAASFRGAAFKVEDHQGEGGRRLQITEYANRDEPFVEDLGRKARSWKIVGYVIGNNYFGARDALIKACEEAGAGTLVHPYLGQLRVCAGAFSYRESKSEGGLCRFEMEFHEAGQNKFPSAAIDTRGNVVTQADIASGRSVDDFGRRYNVAGHPDFVANSAAARLRQLSGAVRTARGLSGGGVSGVLDQRLLGFAGANQATAGAADLGSSVVDLVQAFRASSSPRQGFAGLDSLSSYGSVQSPLSYTTPSRQQVVANDAALARLVRRNAAIEQARLASYVEFRDPATDPALSAGFGSPSPSDEMPEWTRPRASLADPLPPYDRNAAPMVIQSRDDAYAFGSRIRTALDGAIQDAGDAGDDATFDALTDLRAASLADIRARSADLRPVRSYDLPSGAPAPVLAYRLYGDPARATELAQRNRAAHPLFLPRRGEALSA